MGRREGGRARRTGERREGGRGAYLVVTLGLPARVEALVSRLRLVGMLPALDAFSREKGGQAGEACSPRLSLNTGKERRRRRGD